MHKYFKRKTDAEAWNKPRYHTLRRGFFWFHFKFGAISSICMIQRRQLIEDTMPRNPACMGFIDVSAVKCLSTIQYAFKWKEWHWYVQTKEQQYCLDEKHWTNWGRGEAL